MGAKKLRIVLVDDMPAEGEQYAQLLSNNRLDVTYIAPSAELDLQTLNRQADLFLLDYELIKEQPDGTGHVDYFGGTLAAQIRAILPDKPILLITRRNLLIERYHHERLIQSNNAVDDVLFKEEIDRAPDAYRALLIELVKGFQTLNAKPSTAFSVLCEAMNTSEEAEPLLLKADPPPSDWQAFEAARWIRKVILMYPGILYDSLHAATLLGIDEEGFFKSNVQTLFKKAKYTGIFNPPSGRWWGSQLIRIADEFMHKQGMNDPINETFARAYLKRYGEALPRAVCVFSNEAPADWVCYILKQPVKIDYSLPYRPDNRPPIMDEARVSFRAIRESNQVREELFDAKSLQRLEAIRKESPE